MIRSVIFNNILDYATLPKESAGEFKEGFYYIVILPEIKIIKKNYAVISLILQITFVKSSIRKCLMEGVRK